MNALNAVAQAARELDARIAAAHAAGYSVGEIRLVADSAMFKAQNERKVAPHHLKPWQHTPPRPEAFMAPDGKWTTVR